MIPQIEPIRLESLSFGEGLLALGWTLDELLELQSQEANRALERQGILPERIPAKEAFDAFESNAGKVASDEQLAESSIRTYKKILKQFYIYCGKMTNGEPVVSDISTYCIDYLLHKEEAFVRKTGRPQYAPSNWNKHVAILHAFMRFVAQKYKLTPIKINRRKLDNYMPRALKDDAIQNLLHLARASRYGIRTHFLVYFALSTGIRRAEIRDVQLRDLNLNTRTLRIHGKGGRDRVIPISKAAVPKIEQYMSVYGITRPTDYLYGDPGNPQRQVSLQAIDKVVHRLCKKLYGYENRHPVYGYTLHSLRHTYATTLLLRRVPIRVIADLLGHHSVKTTQRYTVLDTEGLRTVAGDALEYVGQLLEGRMEGRNRD